MNITYKIRCSDCGSLALRSYLISAVEQADDCPHNQTIKTECPSCDYLLITCSVSGKVIDAHSSSTSVIARQQNTNKSSPVISLPTKPIIAWSTKLSA